MIKFKSQPPYTGNQTNFRYTAGKSGVYLIYRDSKPAYIGMSKTNVYRTMYRHFQSWDDPLQKRVTYSKRSKSITVRVVLCTPLQAHNLEKALIKKYKPKDNPNKYLSFVPKKVHEKLISDFIGAKVEDSPF